MTFGGRSIKLLADLAGLEGAFVDELQQFTVRTVAATLREDTAIETDEKEKSA